MLFFLASLADDPTMASLTFGMTLLPMMRQMSVFVTRMLKSSASASMLLAKRTLCSPL